MSGVWKLDVTDPSRPQLLGRALTTIGDAGIVAQNGSLLVTDLPEAGFAPRLWVMDLVRNQTNFIELDETAAPVDVAATSDAVYVVDRTGSLLAFSQEGLDLSKVFVEAIPAGAQGVAGASSTFWTDRVYVVGNDQTDPNFSYFQMIQYWEAEGNGLLKMSGAVSDLAVSEDFAYVVGPDGVRVVDLENPKASLGSWL